MNLCKQGSYRNLTGLPGQNYFFDQTFPYLWSFSRLFKALKISTLNSRTSHTFQVSVWTLCRVRCRNEISIMFSQTCTCLLWTLDVKWLLQLTRGVFRGGGGVRGGMPPNRRLSGFLWEKNGFVGTVLSTRNVLWTSNMPKMHWQPGLCPGPRWGSLRRSPRPPSQLGRGHTLPNPHHSRHSIFAPQLPM